MTAALPATPVADETYLNWSYTVRSWLLLEHPGPWGRDAPADAAG